MRECTEYSEKLRSIGQRLELIALGELGGTQFTGAVDLIAHILCKLSRHCFLYYEIRLLWFVLITESEHSSDHPFIHLLTFFES